MKHSIIVGVTLSFLSSLLPLWTVNCAPVDQKRELKLVEDREITNDGADVKLAATTLLATDCFNDSIDLPLPILSTDSRISISCADLDVNLIIRVSAPRDEVSRRRRQASAGRKMSLQQALTFVDEYGLKNCVARASCELACDSGRFGRAGRSLARLMAVLVKRSTIPGVPADVVDFYRSSFALGSRLKGKECRSECGSQYPGCTRPTPALLRMVSFVDLPV